MLYGLTVLTATLLSSASHAVSPIHFPISLQAQWTDNLQNCGSEDTGGMLVGAKTIEFYEAKGKPNFVRTEEDGTITAILNYRGEGKTWTETNRYLISEDRKSVQVSALGRIFTLKRCV